MKKRWRHILLAALGVVLVIGVFAREYRNVTSEPINSWSVDSYADCGVALTGGAGRVREGFALLAQKKIKKLIVSGVHPDVELRELAPQFPFLGDVSEKDVVLERRSGTTYGNAQQSLAITETLQCRDILLITSQRHMYRAYRTFAAAFPQPMVIMKHTVVASQTEQQLFETSSEILKTVFYSLWAY